VFERDIECLRINGKLKLFEGISELDIFHGITDLQENKPLNISNKNGLFTIEWE